MCTIFFPQFQRSHLRANVPGDNTVYFIVQSAKHIGYHYTTADSLSLSRSYYQGLWFITGAKNL